MFGHAPHADRQHNADDGGQPLRYGGHGCRDREQEHLDHFETTSETEEEDHDGYRDRCCPDEGTEPRQPTLEGGLVLAGLLDTGSDVTDDGVHPRRNHDGRTTSARDRRGHPQHIDLVAHLRVFRYRVRHLLHRIGLAGECRLIDLQVHALQHPGVCGYPVAGLEHQDITDHDLLCGYHQHLVVAQDARFRGGESAQRFECFARSVLLQDTDEGVECYDRSDHGGIDRVTGGQRDGGRGDEHVDERAAELVEDELQHSDAVFGAQFVRAVLIQAFFRLFGRES